MPQGERFQFDRLSEAELEHLRRFLEIKRGTRRPIILSPDELLVLLRNQASASSWEDTVAKGQKRSNREKKRPKALGSGLIDRAKR
jgi:hypothetical protein